jgi:hypothetical protein
MNSATHYGQYDHSNRMILLIGILLCCITAAYIIRKSMK